MFLTGFRFVHDESKPVYLILFDLPGGSLSRTGLWNAHSLSRTGGGRFRVPFGMLLSRTGGYDYEML